MTIGMIVSGQAQTAQLEARVTATSGNAVFISRASGLSSPIRRGHRLMPGDEIETRGDGRVILTLTDGSQVNIHPNSRVVIKDFRAAPSVREMIDVLVGYVRIKIYRTGKRPNPYRVNTPVASIAVRGTSFGVRVAITGETHVAVFEGEVEVTSRANPQQKRLLSPGRSVVVRPSGDIGLLAPGAGSELNAITNLAGVSPSVQVLLNAQNYIDNITSSAGGLSGTSASFERFLAYADSHFDSQENPAYATQFTKPGGRSYLLPSFSVSQKTSAPGWPEGSRSDYSSYSAAEHTSYFLPIKGTRITLGGTLTLAHSQLHSKLNYGFAVGDLPFEESGRFDATTFNWSAIVARRFGKSERTSLGIQFDQLTGYSNKDYSQPIIIEETPALYQRDESDQVRRSRVTVGLSRDFAEGKKLGGFYRYGTACTNQHSSTSIGSYLSSGENTSQKSRSSEIGMRWRSSFTRRLYYGLHGSMLFNKTSAAEGKIEQLSRRVVFGGGIGYEFRRQTTIAFDVAGGSFQRTYKNIYPGNETRDLFPGIRMSDRFLTLHVGGQTDLGQRFFVNGSLFGERGKGSQKSFQPPNSIIPISSTEYFRRNTFLNLGPGWRITRNLSAQYIYSRNALSENNSNSVMLLYNFGAAER